jgi:hypothetical protein
MTPHEARMIASVKTALTRDLLLPAFRDRPGNPMFGFCRVATEALYHLLGGKEAGYMPRTADDHICGCTHWWLRNPAGEIIDPTVEQYADFQREPPYRFGRSVVIRGVSKRAKIVLDRLSKCSS